MTSGPSSDDPSVPAGPPGPSGPATEGAPADVAVPASVSTAWRAFAVGFGQELPRELNRAVRSIRRLRQTVS